MGTTGKIINQYLKPFHKGTKELLSSILVTAGSNLKLAKSFKHFIFIGYFMNGELSGKLAIREPFHNKLGLAKSPFYYFKFNFLFSAFMQSLHGACLCILSSIK